jgi:class 3 adenylate cyclase
MKPIDPADKLQEPGKAKHDIEFDDLKGELLDSFFLNMFGAKTYYKLREDFGSLIWQESFMDTNALLTTPLTQNGKTRYLITWVFDSAGIRDQFPAEDLRTDPDRPLFTLFGNDQYLGARPNTLNILSRDFPDLVELGNQALITGSRLFMQDYTASGAPVLEARPARYSDFIICGRRNTRDIESITGELLAEALRYLAWIAVCGISLALLTSLYFTLPIRQLTQATRQIAEGNYAVRLVQRHPDDFAIASAAFNKMAIGLQQGELLNSFVSESVKKLADRNELSSSDIARKIRATVLFSSIRNSAAIQQQNEPERIFAILQAHLSAAVAAVEQYGGEIDKMIEDKVMIVFESQRQNEQEQAAAAVSVAISIKNAMQKNYSLQTAAGITSGEVVSGIMGAGNVRLSKTVVGDTVNLAARLASVADGLPGGGIVASGSTVENISDDYHCEKLPISQIKGKTHTVEAFSVSRKTV